MAVGRQTMTIEQELQVIRLVQRSPAWNCHFPTGTQMRATFFKFPPDPSPMTSDEEDNPLVIRASVLPKPPRPNVVAAGLYVNRLFTDYLPNCHFAIVGGLALRILQVPQDDTSDVDVFYRGQMTTLFGILLQARRVILPETPLYGSCFQMYLRTGPDFKDPACNSNHIVKVELLLQGLQESGFQQFTFNYRFDFRGQTQTLRTLQHFFLTKSKIHAFCDKGRFKDYQDVLALIRKFPGEIRSQKWGLDGILARIFVKEMVDRNESAELVDRAREILLINRNP